MTNLSAASNLSQPHIHDPVHGDHRHDPAASGQDAPRTKLWRTNSMLGWPAWQRMLAVLPVVALLWLAVGWAGAEIKPW